ncbi:MAG: branched-chain amino acid ABC transporter permease [Shinella sp.]|jgi:branched-chain amino acid transport system permease protein|uniref:branched-chain amino acid ABC transporter permease n=1 Tax=Shinella sp. TaxID=1870904 RepID=UPI003C75EFEE
MSLRILSPAALRMTGYAAVAALVAAIAILPFFPSPSVTYAMGLILQIMLFVYLAQAWNIAGGFAGLFSLGHSAFFGLGAYSYAIGVAKYGLDPTVCFLIGGLLAAGLGVVTAIISTRLSGMFFAMVTLGLNEILLNLASQLTWLTNGDAGTYLRKQFTVSAGTAYYLFLVLCIVIFVLAALVRHSKLGTMCVAVKENEAFARALGVNPAPWKIAAVVISAIMTAIGGGFFAMYQGIVSPTMVFTFSISIKMLIVTMIGGVGTLWGPLAGAFLVLFDELVRASLGATFGGVSLIAYGAILVFSALFLPKGIMEAVRKHLLDRSARHG